MPGTNVSAPSVPRSSDPTTFALLRSGAPRRHWMSLGWVVLVSVLSGWLAPAGATAATVATATKVVRYHGDRLVVPAGWPVYRLGAGHSTCVRFNRHAVYLGQPSAVQSCPPEAVGRTEALSVEPLGSAAGPSGATGSQVLPLGSTAGASPAHGSSARLVESARGVVVTATWNHDPAVIERALGVRSLDAIARPTSERPQTAAVTAASSLAHAPATARAASASAVPASVYTGLGFDACSTPSSSQMAAWGSSPYRGIGVYIGGANMACSQTNLTASWVGQQIAAGWHLVPIYVGLQAPSNSCGCASISSATAASQGAAAAQDAVVKAQAVGLGPGSPVYFDMEGYTRTTVNTSAVLAFLASWTSQLHASGYQSGVYSSDDSGIRDLVAQTGTGYQEPDDLWMANWNGAQSTSDANVPSADWSAHQRLHQYQGGHNETYGGVTINIDNDYLDGATAGSVSATPAIASAPSLSVSPVADGTIKLRPSWSGGAGVSSWQVLGGATPDSLSPAANPVSASASAPIVLHSAFAYFAVRALGSSGATLATSLPTATPAHVVIFGHSAFVSSQGMGGVPVACFGVTQCVLTTTISTSRRTLARTGPEVIAPGGGLAYFHLSAASRAVLAGASHHQLLVKIAVQAAGGQSASRQLKLIPFSTTGTSPRRSVSQASGLRIIGATEFVSNGRFGGVLADCLASAPCQTSVTILAAGKVIARTRPESLGVNELGYLFFSLTGAGHRLLTGTGSNQLPARLTITAGSDTATARIALASYR